MIFGIGCDLIEIQRIEAALLRHGDRFAERVLGPDELRVWRRRTALHARRGMLYLATRFAAKEAISKALGLGMRTPMSWRNVEILNAHSGRPIAVAHGLLYAFMQQHRLILHITLTDERSMAMAQAIAETEAILSPPSSAF